MKNLLLLALIAAGAARADFSYTTTAQSSGMMGGSQTRTSKHLMKGDKLKMDSDDMSSIIDLGAQTLTTINHKQKTYKVTTFAELTKGTGPAGTDVVIDFKDTGETKTINGLKARLYVLSMDIDSPQGQGMKMKMVNDMWVSNDVPGGAEARSFYQRNGAKMPWAALAGGGGNPRMAKQVAELQKKMASLNGLPVLQVMKMTAPGSEEKMAQMKSQMGDACAKIEEMKKKGGPGAAMAENMAKQMGCGTPQAKGSGSGALMEVTTESSNFSSAAIPASAFEVPAGYKQDK